MLTDRHTLEISFSKILELVVQSFHIHQWHYSNFNTGSSRCSYLFNFEDFPLICVAVNVTRATVCINVSPLSHLIPKFTSLLCECTLHKIPVFKKQFTVLYFLLYHNQVKVTLN